MNREKHFHPLAALHLLRKTLLVYLLPLVQVLFDRNWDALRAALRQDLVLLFFISAVCWAVYYGGRWQVDAEGTVHVSWRLGVRLDRALRAEGLAALMLEQPLLYRLTGACRVVLYPVGQTKTITLYLTRQQAEELADVLLPVTNPLWHAPKGGEKLAFTVLGANGLSTLILWWLAIHQTQSYAPDAQTAALAQLGQLAALAARWLPLGMAWLLVLAGTLFCISLVRSALQAVHYTVWRTDTQLGSRGGFIRRYEMRLRLSQLNYADLRRSPATWALHYCPVFVSAGACRPELPLFVWREGTPLLRELLPEMAQLPPDTRADTTDRSMVFFLPAGIPLALCLLLGALAGLCAVHTTSARLERVRANYAGRTVLLTAEVERADSSYFSGTVDATLWVESVNGSPAGFRIACAELPACAAGQRVQGWFTLQ